MKINQAINCNRRGALSGAAFGAVSMMSVLVYSVYSLAIILGMLIVLMPLAAFAQSPQDVEQATATNSTDAGIEADNDSEAENVEASASTGPKIYITDASGLLSTVTLGTYSVHHIGHEGAALTDIAFNPEGQLYGISFQDFYKVSRTTGRATLIGSLGISDANSLVFDAQGVAYTEGVNSSELYTINIKTGEVSPVGSTAPFKSAGDLTFYDGGLVLSGYYQSSFNRNTPDTLALLNPKTGQPLAYAKLNVPNLFGLVCTGKDILFGFAGTSIYRLLPGETNVADRAVLLQNLGSKRIAQIYGAAYDGYFLY